MDKFGRSEMKRRDLIGVALGVDPPDLVIRSATLVNVISRELHPADIVVKGSRIAAVLDPGGEYDGAFASSRPKAGSLRRASSIRTSISKVP